MNEDRTLSNSGTELTQADSPSVLATTLRRKQHLRNPRERGIYDNIIQILDPKGAVNPAMRAELRRRQVRCLERGGER